MADEIFDIVDDVTGKVIGTALRKECHGNPALIHRSVRVILFDPEHRGMYLQKRSMKKDIQPGRWDMAVGGHLDHGEDYERAAHREMQEELGLPELPLTYCFDMKVRNEIESENLQEFSAEYAGDFRIQESELEEVRFFSFDALQKMLEKDPESMTPLLRLELQKILPEL